MDRQIHFSELVLNTEKQDMRNAFDSIFTSVRGNISLYQSSEAADGLSRCL